MNTIPENVVETLLAADRVVLVTHVHPDGDALGSLLGFAEILEGLGKKVFRYLEEPVSNLLDFLPGCDRAETDPAAVESFAGVDERVVAVSLDCGDSERLGKNKDELLKISPFLVIDHHRGHRTFGDMSWVDCDRSSTGEMIYELALRLDANISPDSAFNLYVAITTDTGSFRYENTSPRTHRIAAELQEKGVRPEVVANLVYDNFTLQRLRLMEKVLSTLTLFEDDQLALIRATAQMLKESGAESADLEGFINYPRALRTVKVAALIKEGAAGGVSVSLRAKGECDVARVAAGFGGGGHRNASGFRFSDKSVEEVEQLVIRALKDAIGHGND
ncbi:MAG: bifunctional oligoribonuclease/PAP phosphatase NrnA [Thermodesulfobacteriota bacterium]